MITDHDIRLEWVERVLKSHGIYLTSEFRKSIQGKSLIFNKDLINSLNYNVNRGGSSDDGILEISFKTHGRFQDMGAGRGSNKTDELLANADFLGLRVKSKRKRKPAKWYARNLFGTMNSLISQLTYGLTKETVEVLRSELENI
jgi:hypothetical protein